MKKISDTFAYHLIQLYGANEKVAAIKACRGETGEGLKEAKFFVEGLFTYYSMRKDHGLTDIQGLIGFKSNGIEVEADDLTEQFFDQMEKLFSIWKKMEEQHGSGDLVTTHEKS